MPRHFKNELIGKKRERNKKNNSLHACYGVRIADLDHITEYSVLNDEPDMQVILNSILVQRVKLLTLGSLAFNIWHKTDINEVLQIMYQFIGQDVNYLNLVLKFSAKNPQSV